MWVLQKRPFRKIQKKSDKYLFTLKYITVQRTKVKKHFAINYPMISDSVRKSISKEKNGKRELPTTVFLVNSFNGASAHFRPPISDKESHL
jgi:hypothetical protein